MNKIRSVCLGGFTTIIIGLTGCGGGSSDGGAGATANSNSCVTQTTFMENGIEIVRLINNCNTAVNVGRYITIGTSFSENFRLEVGDSKEFIAVLNNFISCPVPSSPLIFPGANGSPFPTVFCNSPVL